ncbi:histidine kinase [Vibrio caribbeanicus]|uniref:Histidine kinase n=1 Tax=Vibrio caribbeanicus TaxID=701175 RepID=A0ACC4NTX8_9VIBR|nr:sensor histidine kinase [Vibrio caribbeanicus]KHD23920.1 histidine kinase [Vibrio caribbeanicus]
MATQLFPRSFTMHLTLLLCGALSLGSVGWWLMSTERLNQVLAEQVALRAQVQSQQLSRLPSLLDAVARQDAVAVTSIVEQLQKATDADFITVSDKNGIRLAHPVKSRIGFPVVGGDIEHALETGESYLSHSVGSLGPSVRYITPLFGHKGEVIGMIKVGYLKQSIAVLNDQMLSPLLLFAGFSLLVSGLAAWRFSRYVRDKMQHLEPWQLQQALRTSQGVLQAAHEGLVAVNCRGEIYLANDSARQLLSIPPDATLPLPIEFYIPDSAAFALSGEDFIDQLVRVNGMNLVLTRVTLQVDHRSDGAVFSLRAQKELQLLSNKISQVSSYLDSIRVTRHEYQNKLSTVTGLLQLGHAEQALEVLLSQAQESQANMDRLAQLQSLPLVSGLLLANLGKASERGIHVDLNELNGWRSLPSKLDEQLLSTLVGNLVSNSIEALHRVDNGQIRIAMYQTEYERILAVANNGPVINVGLDVLCQLGYTTKGEFRDHGIGLHLVQSIVEEAGGYMEMDSDCEETVFTVYFPEEQGV